MLYTLDRIEDGAIAVLIDENGRKTDIPISKLPEEKRVGNVYNYTNNTFIYNDAETQKRRKSASEKLQKLLSKAVNKK